LVPALASDFLRITPLRRVLEEERQQQAVVTAEFFNAEGTCRHGRRQIQSKTCDLHSKISYGINSARNTSRKGAETQRVGNTHLPLRLGGFARDSLLPPDNHLNSFWSEAVARLREIWTRPAVAR
jgi:hypothetical protein